MWVWWIQAGTHTMNTIVIEAESERAVGKVPTKRAARQSGDWLLVRVEKKNDLPLLGRGVDQQRHTTGKDTLHGRVIPNPALECAVDRFLDPSGREKKKSPRSSEVTAERVVPLHLCPAPGVPALQQGSDPLPISLWLLWHRICISSTSGIPHSPMPQSDWPRTSLPP